ncbi:MAG: UV DNA damage repair endonuclease UvsE [Planctomycetes bacterium]|nr:UV DNA damage repair endonuclease UvsE [Planctomycetota bacterium]
MEPVVGYACKLIGVPGTAITSTILRTATSERLLAIVRHNLAALRRIIDYNVRIGVRLFRISSDIIPFGSHPDVHFAWRDECADELAATAEALKRSGIRVSMHPGQYTVLNSPDDGVAERAILDVVYHADVLDALGAGPDGKIVVHVGGVYGDRVAGMRRFEERFRMLPEFAARRLILENDEHNYPIDDVHRLARRLKMPVVMDLFHHDLLPPAGGTTEEWLLRSAATWKKRDGLQKIHYSQQLPGGKPGMHSNSIAAAAFVAMYQSLPRPAAVMLEVKDKNISARKCLKCLDPRTNRATLTTAWARYKYAVLEHSPAAYQRIRNLLKADQPAALVFYNEVDAALAEPATAGTVKNAAEHVWGYFKEEADTRERKRYDAVFAKADSDTGNASLKKLFATMAEKYDKSYIQESLYLVIPATSYV